MKTKAPESHLYRRRWMTLSVVLGMTAVLAGAFGAHALKQMVSPEYLQIWKTASYYQLVHSILILALSVSAVIQNKKVQAACLFLFIGIIFFSGSLYLYVLTESKLLTILTPFGGVFLTLGWLILLLAARELSAD